LHLAWAMRNIGAKVLHPTEEVPLKRVLVAVVVLGAVGLTAAPANAGVTRNVVWRCTVSDGSVVDFVTAPDTAYHGLSTANAATAHAMSVLGEVCVVVRS